MKQLLDNHYYYPIVIIIILFVLPLFLSLSTYYLRNIISFFEKYFNDGYLGFQLVTNLQYIIFVIMLVIYPIWTLIYPTAKYFKKISEHNAILEYETLRKIAYVLFPIFIFVIFHVITIHTMKSDPLLHLVMLPNNISILIYIFMGISFFIVASVFLKLLVLNIRNDFEFYFAKVCICNLSKNEKDDVKKIRYLIKGLSKYNAFLRRNTGLRIGKLRNIYSKVLSDLDYDKNKSIAELIHAFEDEDKLKPIKYISRILDVKDAENFLVKESIRKKIQNWVTLIGTLVSALTAMISGLMLVIFHKI